MKKKEFYIIGCDDLKIKDKIELSENELKIVKFLPLAKAMVALAFFIVIMLALQLTINQKIEMNKMATAHVFEVEALISELDSVTYCYDESVRMNDLHDAIYDAIMGDPHEKPTKENVWNFIQKCNTWYPDIIMAQAVQESGCGNSAVAKRCHNLFGMTKPNARKLRCDINRHNKSEQYAEYNNWKMSIIDRILWDRWVFRHTKGIPSRDAYLCKIGTVYNTETEGYAQHIDKVSRSYQTD